MASRRDQIAGQLLRRGSVIAFATLTIAGFLYLRVLNPGAVPIRFVSGGKALELPFAFTLLLFFLLGFAVRVLWTFLRDSRAILADYRRERVAERKARAEALLTDGKKALLADDAPMALKRIEESLGVDGENWGAHVLRARLLTESGRLEEARKVLEKVQFRDEHQPESRRLLAEVYERSGDPDKAVRLLEVLIEDDPRDIAARAALVRVLGKAEKWEEAAAAQEELAKAERPARREAALQGLAVIRVRMARRLAETGAPEEGLKLLREVVKKHADFWPAYVELGRLARKVGKDDEAEKTWEKGLRESGLYVFVDALLEMAAEKTQPERLIRALRKNMESAPQDAAFPFYLGLVRLRLELLDEALEAFEKVGALGKDFPELDRAKAETYLRKGMRDEAIEAFK
ncbi:MAG: tetratricopeptide repeat protein, partial [Candidatus Methylomirabilis sp.]|nr:tetratricopeptide repeat protein [Deltaproteobacteria bacterium]